MTASKITADAILEALIAFHHDVIWARELRLEAGSSRVDFWTLEPTASQGFRASAFEIKVSRADFARDSEAKQAAALKWSDRLWYVTPPGLLTREDLPAWAGLQEFDGERFAVARRAPKREKAAPDWDLIVAIVRNAADMGRDVGLLKAQLAFHQQRERAAERMSKYRERWHMDRWTRRARAHGHRLGQQEATSE